MDTQIQDLKLRFLFSIWYAMVKYSNANSKTDINTDSEKILLRIFKILYSLKFENLNEESSCGGIGKKNFPGADIGCLNGECYSITSVNEPWKIADGLDKYDNHELEKYFPSGMKFFILDISSKKVKLNKKLCAKYSFNNNNVLNFIDLAREIDLIRAIDSLKYDEIIELMVKEFVSIFPDLFNTNKSGRETIESIEKGLEKFNDNMNKFQPVHRGIGMQPGINGLRQDFSLCSQDGDNLWKEFANRVNPILRDFSSTLAEIVSLNNKEKEIRFIDSAKAKYGIISVDLDRFDAFLKSANYNAEAREPVIKSIASIKAILAKYEEG